MNVVWFDSLGLEDRATAGGKGASLGELRRASVEVPPGFVVTTAAFRRFVRDSAAASRDAVEAATVPADIARDVVDGYARLCADACSDSLPVAVRSSATAEDGAGASFAGLQDTFLWIRGPLNVLEALRRCWASLYSEPAIAYRRRLDLEEDGAAMGVVVQQMVEPRSAGVMFTRSPISGDTSVVVISSSWGLGSSVVGGEVTPDEFVVNKITGVVQRSTVSCKEIRHVPNETGSGTRIESVSPDLQTKASLGPQELRELCDVARRIEKHYGCAQDIEWAIDVLGKVFVLQSRPETVWNLRDRDRSQSEVAMPKEKPFDHVVTFFSPRKK